MTGSLDLAGRVAVVTGAGAGLGRAEALELARAGARLVLNDLVAPDEVVAEVRALGTDAVGVAGDIGDSAVAEAVIAAATGELGGLDIVVNNAGITRDRMLFNMSDEEFDAVLRVHLRGHFLLTRNAASYWRGKHKETGEQVYGRIVNTASEAFLTGSPGQANYAAAKAGIAALTLSAARGMKSMGVTANAICPRARTAMTAAVFGDDESGRAVDPYSPEHVAPLVTWLATPAAQHVSGQVFVVYGGMVAVLAPPTVAQRFDTQGDTWDLAELDRCVGAWLEDSEGSFAADSVMKLSI